jgi:hypothetical protein
MGRLKLQPREFRLRAGARSEMDRHFLQIVNHLPEDTNLSEFIKTAVVEHFQRQSKLSEADLLQQEFLELQERFWDFIENLKRLTDKTLEVEKVTKLRADLRDFAETIKET